MRLLLLLLLPRPRLFGKASVVSRLLLIEGAAPLEEFLSGPVLAGGIRRWGRKLEPEARGAGLRLDWRSNAGEEQPLEVEVLLLDVTP